MSGETETPSTAQSGSSTFEDTVKDFWSSRPRRPHEGRKVAGVAAGIGNRYNIDPVVVRVVFVVATLFGGVGPLLYVLGWLFLPDEREKHSAFEALVHRGPSSPSRGFTIVLCILLFPLSGLAFSGDWFGNDGWFGGGGLIALVLFAVGLYLLHHNRGYLNRPQVSTSDAQPLASSAPTTFTATSPAAPTVAPSATSEYQSESGEPTTNLSRSNPGYDKKPDGTDEATTQLPAWTPPVDSGVTTALSKPKVICPKPPKSKVGLVTFGAALLVAGVGVALAISGMHWFSAQHIVGLTLGVLGLGLVAGGFLRGARGLVFLVIPLWIVGLTLTYVPFSDFRGGVGNTSETPVTAAELRPIYQRSAGIIELDLTQLPADVPVITKIDNGAGSSTVRVPTNADVRFSCIAKVGNVDCFGHKSQGFGNSAIAGEDLGEDGRGGPQITLEIKNAVGNVEVYRA